METTTKRVVRIRRALLAALVGGIVWVLLALFVGAAVPGLVATLLAGPVLIGLIVWLVLYAIESSAAHRNAAEGTSWRPPRGTER